MRVCDVPCCWGVGAQLVEGGAGSTNQVSCQKRCSAGSVSLAASHGFVCMILFFNLFLVWVGIFHMVQNIALSFVQYIAFPWVLSVFTFQSFDSHLHCGGVSKQSLCHQANLLSNLNVSLLLIPFFSFSGDLVLSSWALFFLPYHVLFSVTPLLIMLLAECLKCWRPLQIACVAAVLGVTVLLLCLLRFAIEGSFPFYGFRLWVHR